MRSPKDRLCLPAQREHRSLCVCEFNCASGGLLLCKGKPNACASSWFFEIMQNMRTGISSKESTALEVSWYLRPSLALCPLPCCGRLENVSTWMCRSILDFPIFWWYRVASCSAKLCTQEVASAAKQESNDHHALAAGWRELAPVTYESEHGHFKTSWQGREMCRYNTPPWLMPSIGPWLSQTVKSW